MVVSSKKIVFSGNANEYNAWAEALYKRGYNCSIDSVMKLLDVSLSWVRHTLLKEIHYVTYSYKYLFQKGIKSHTTTYINMEELEKWVEEKGMFMRQTELIDLYSYISLADKKKANKILKSYKEMMEKSNIGYNPGIVPEKILKEVNNDFYINFSPKNLSSTKRNNVKWTYIKPFNIFEKQIYFPGHTTDELLYRNAFMNGDIKVSLGNKKTIMIKTNNNLSQMKMPFLIPYNKKILVQNRK